MAKQCTRLLVCTKGKHCSANDGPSVLKKLRKTIEKCELDKFFKVKKSGCLGYCRYAPVISVESNGFYYGRVRESDCQEIIERHLAKKKPLKRLLLPTKKSK
jgi:(2Fe-2S) ferredoxin